MQKQNKALLIEHLRKTPIVAIGCKKSGIGRATYYRWCQEDKKFKKAAEEAVREGIILVNDMAESQLISSIQEKNMTAIIFWLKNHHQDYRERIELNATKSAKSEELTPEEQIDLKKAIELTAPSKVIQVSQKQFHNLKLK